MDTELRELVARAKSGDEEAFGRVYDLLYTPIYRFIFFQVRHLEDAADLTQTTFFKALKNIESFQERGAKFSTWIYTIARNTVIDHWKKKKDSLMVEAEHSELIESDYDLVAEVHQKEKAMFVRNLIEDLSQEQREIMILYFVEELSYKEIAEIVGKREDAIRALKYRALKSLKKRIDSHENNYEL